MIWTWRWNCSDAPAAVPTIPRGTGTLVLDWQWSCRGAEPPPLTAVSVCIACNVALVVRVLSPGDNGALTQVVGPGGPSRPAPVVPPPSVPSAPVVAAVVPAVPAVVTAPVVAEVQPPTTDVLAGGAPALDGAAEVTPRIHRVRLPAGMPSVGGVRGLHATAVVPARLPPFFAVAARFPIEARLPIEAQLPIEDRSLVSPGPALAARSLRTRAPAPRRTPAPAEHRAPSGPPLPAAPLGAVAAAAFGGAGHGGHAGAAGSAVLLAILLASLADLSRRLVPRRLRLVAQARPGRLERPG